MRAMLKRRSIWQRIGFKIAAVAVARKLAVIMHTMLKTGELFNPNAGSAVKSG